MSNAGLTIAATEVAAVASGQADAAERRREVDPAVMAAVVEAGFARHFAPVEFGGREGSFAELIGAVGVIAQDCPASSWCASLIASITRMAGAFLPGEGQREIWASGPDTVLVGSATPLGAARACAGGWTLSGRWPYISAISYSDWALVCGVVHSGTTSEAKLFAVPRSAYRVEDTWHTVGMRATGSKTLALDEIFVPERRAFDRSDLLAGRTRDSLAAVSNCYRAPLQAVNALMFAAPAVGAALGMAKVFSAYFAEKVGNAQPIPGTTGVQGVRSSAELALARASGEADAARLLLERAAQAADQATTTAPAETARNLRDCSLAADMAVTAVDRLFRQAGTRGQSTSGVMQRLWRDVTTISTHVALQFEPAARSYADQLLKS
jgi:alkylation response protein AidB-like acyl-CoA dehydrogenase